jgi:hypothetical protein
MKRAPSASTLSAVSIAVLCLLAGRGDPVSSRPTTAGAESAPLPHGGAGDVIIYVEPVRSDSNAYAMFVEDLLRMMTARSGDGTIVARWPDRVGRPPETWAGDRLKNQLLPNVAGRFGDASASLGPAEFQAGLAACAELGDKRAEIVIVSANAALSDFPTAQREAVKSLSKKRTVDLVWYGTPPVPLAPLASGYCVAVDRGTVGGGKNREAAK